jgi:hypothetical protein
VICGGAHETYYVDGKTPYWGDCDDSLLVEPAKKHFESVMQDNFIGWEESGAIVDYIWTASK